MQQITYLGYFKRKYPDGANKELFEFFYFLPTKVYKNNLQIYFENEHS